jgi:hypothetical protein
LRLLTFAGAPALELLAVRKIETLEEIALERLRRLAQCVGRNGICAVSGNAAQGQDVYCDTIKVESDLLAVGDDSSTVMVVDEGPQAAQTPPQCGTGIIRDGPEHGAEPVAAVRTRGDGQIGEQSPRFF